MSNGGTKANTRGSLLEGHVRSLLSEEYERTTARRFFALRCLEQPIFSEQVIVGTNIYATRRQVDFILYHPRRWPDCLVLQCKWQTSGGSVDEKYPFEVACIQQGAFQTIIVLDGGGYREGARQWLLGQRDGEKLLDVCNMGDIARMQSQGRI